MNNLEHHIIHEEKCEIGDIILRNDKILMFKPFEDVNSCSIDHLKEMHSIFMDLTKGVPHLYFSDNSRNKNLDVGSAEKTFIKNTIHEFAKACAVSENSALVRYMSHSFLYLYKPKIPIKLFKTEKDSINWLKSLEL